MVSPWRASVLVVLLAAIASGVFAGPIQRKMRDFEVYWTAGGRARAAEPLYRPGDGHYRFKYLPGFAVAMEPLARLPLPAAKRVWFGLSLVCLAAFVFLSAACVRQPQWRRGLIAALTVVTLAKFFAHEVVLGQANLLFGVLCAAGLVALVRGRDVTAGAVFGAAALVKPYAVVFVPYLLMTGRWRGAAAACVALLMVLLLPVPEFGPRGTLGLTMEWWRVVSETSVPLLTNPDSISVFAMWAKWVGWGRMAATLSLATLALLAAAFVWMFFRRARVRDPEVLEVALLMTLIPLGTPQGWDYALLLSAPLVALLLGRMPGLPRVDQLAAAVGLAVVAFSIYDVMGRAAYAAFMALSIITACYLVLVAIALRLRGRGEA